MSMKTLGVVGGTGGGPAKIAADPGRARNIHVTVANPSNATHAAFFGRSRRELEGTPPLGQTGFAVVAVANTVATATVNNVAYTSYVLQAWAGELWAVADVDSILQVDVMDSAVIEK